MCSNVSPPSYDAKSFLWFETSAHGLIQGKFRPIASSEVRGEQSWPETLTRDVPRTLFLPAFVIRLFRLLLTLLSSLNGSVTIPVERQTSLSVCLVTIENCLVANFCPPQNSENLFLFIIHSASQSAIPSAIIIISLLCVRQGIYMLR